MTENEITTKMEELPVDVRARCFLSAFLNIYRQANDLGTLSADEIEATVNQAWKDHKASNEESTPAVAVQRVVSVLFGELKLSGCERHPHRLDLSCFKIRQADGTALTTKQVWEVLNELANRPSSGAALCDCWRRDADQYQRQVEEARSKNLPHDQMLSMMTCLRSCARDLENIA